MAAPHTNSHTQSPAAAARKSTAALGTVNAVTTALVRLNLPEATFDQYAAQADRAGVEVEKLMESRLTQALPQTDAGLWLTLAQKKRLEACVGRTLTDGEGALQRLEPLSRITVEGQVIRLDPTLLKRLSTRTRRGQTLQQLIEQEVVKALKQYVGLLPY